ncbi:MAG: lipase family protein [Pirellulales bacterium]
MTQVDLFHCVPPPLEPRDSAFNRTNALYLAHAADIAYHRSPEAAARTRLGLTAIPFRSKLTRARGFLGVCDTHAVLSFRGTDPITLPNWLTVAVVRLVTCGEYSGRVHRGFSYAMRRTWHKVEAVLNAVRGKPLFVTGHSMGGALAVLAACRLAQSGRPPTAVYTFGALRVGDLGFCNGYGVPTYRVVNRLDFVPELPLASAKLLLPPQLRAKFDDLRGPLRIVAERIFDYGHVRTLVYIHGDHSIAIDADVRPWNVEAVATALADRGKTFLEGVTNHMIANYIRTLATEVDDQDAGSR